MKDNTVTPRFFRMDDNSVWQKKYAWGNICVPYENKTCPQCGRVDMVRFGPGRVEVDRGREWPDAIGSAQTGTNPPFIISQRVLDVLHNARIAKFSEDPAVIEKIGAKSLRDIPPPRYYYLTVTGEISVDFDAGGASLIDQCPVCFRSSSGGTLGSRFVPLSDTWDGSDIFRIRNLSGDAIFCTLKIVDLARQHGWTNFLFEPMDISEKQRQESHNWKGIDYLGKPWPPAQWYPEPVYVGRTPLEWVRHWLESVAIIAEQTAKPKQERSRKLVDKHSEERYRAYRALLLLKAPETVDGIASMLDHELLTFRAESARLLHEIDKNHPLPPDLKAKVAAVGDLRRGGAAGRHHGRLCRGR